MYLVEKPDLNPPPTAAAACEPGVQSRFVDSGHGCPVLLWPTLRFSWSSSHFPDLFRWSTFSVHSAVSHSESMSYCSWRFLDDGDNGGLVKTVVVFRPHC